MSRTERLLDLLQILRRHRRPVGGPTLAAELGISIRTLYRDIATLQGQGAQIEGAPGLGYVLEPGFVLPPLMFSEDEIEAMILGSRWVAGRGDARLGAAAENAIAKIADVLPADLRGRLDASTLLVGPKAHIEEVVDLAALREAIRAERKIEIAYTDLAGKRTTRTVWPFALGFFDRARVLVAWCELRGANRHFQTSRISALRDLGARYPRRRSALMKEWRQAHPEDPRDAAAGN